MQFRDVLSVGVFSGVLTAFAPAGVILTYQQRFVALSETNSFAAGTYAVTSANTVPGHGNYSCSQSSMISSSRIDFSLSAYSIGDGWNGWSSLLYSEFQVPENGSYYVLQGSGTCRLDEASESIPNYAATSRAQLSVNPDAFLAGATVSQSGMPSANSEASYSGTGFLWAGFYNLQVLVSSLNRAGKAAEATNRGQLVFSECPLRYVNSQPVSTKQWLIRYAGEATFNVAPSILPADVPHPTYLWEMQDTDGAWIEVEPHFVTGVEIFESSVTSSWLQSTITISTHLMRQGFAASVRCKVVNACGDFVVSDSATIEFINCLGDLDRSNAVDDSDFVIFVAAYDLLDCASASMPDMCPSDFTGDGLVDDSDFVEFVRGYSAVVCP